MKKSVFYLLLLLNVFILSCRSEESVPEKTEFVAPITAFKNFDEKIASDLSYKARHLQNIESAKKNTKTNYSKATQSTSTTIDIPISDVSYKTPFRQTIENYFANHPDYAQSFYNEFGQPFFAVSTYTYGYSGNALKAIAFPIMKGDLVTGIIHGVVSANRDYVFFRVVQNNDNATQKVIADLQYEIDNLYPKNPEIMSRIIREREARQREIEEVTLYYLYDRSGGGSWNISLPNYYWYRDANITFEGNGGTGAGGKMSGGASKHNNKFPDYMDPNDDPCEKIKTNLSDAKFSEKTSSLNNSTTLNYDHEMGFASSYAPAGTNLGTQYQPMDNRIGTHSVTLPDGNRFFGFIHTHNNQDGVIKIFSPADIMTFLTSCVGNASTNGNIGDAYAMVITSEGSYMLQYTGATANFANLASSLSNWNVKYREMFQDYVDNDNLTQSIVENEFLKFLKNTVNINGLELYKVDSTTSKKLSLNTNNTTNATQCP
ncbi:hypothetical protein [Cloacibacterium sp.]|uniref:hypothetical protein n=1 Tax=Cloacibacterium sp. TaxID=1913682 RepID=UPI0039E6D36E